MENRKEVNYERGDTVVSICGFSDTILVYYKAGQYSISTVTFCQLGACET